MTLYRSIIPAVVVLGLTTACSKTQEASKTSENTAQAEQASYPDWTGKEAPAPQSTVDPSAVAAIQAMSTYLAGLKTFKLNTVGTMDVVTADGQRIQVDGTTQYEAKKPGIRIHYDSDIKKRDFYYDGKNFTTYSPALGFYSTVPAPPTNKEFLDAVYDHYGIRLPLEDLFRWNDSRGERISGLRSAGNLGTVTLDGVKTTHYAFREPDVDWEVWIDQGDKPLPRKLSIVDRTDPARPAFTTRLSWTVNPSLPDSDFTFKPGPDAKKIPMAEYQKE